MPPQPTKTERHVIWNFERSPDNPDMARYHFVVVDDKGRRQTLLQIQAQLQQAFGAIEIIREIERKVKGTKFRYLFQSFDANGAPRLIDFSTLRRPSRPVVMDTGLYERVSAGSSIEEYVAKKYET